MSIKIKNKKVWQVLFIFDRRYCCVIFRKYDASSNILAPLTATRDVSLALSLMYCIDILIVSVVAS